MAGFDQLKKAFFDRQKVQGAVEKAKLRVLSKFGRYVWTRAKTSIKKAPADRTKAKVRNEAGRKVFQKQSASQPGNPPFDRGGPLKRMLFFARDEATGGVVVGPMIFPSKVKGTPARLEFGGTLRIVKRGRKARTANYLPRPFMAPALEAERSKFADLFKDAVLTAGAK